MLETFRSRQWGSALLELLLPVSLMFLLIWIRSEVHKENGKSFLKDIDSSHPPKNNIRQVFL